VFLSLLFSEIIYKLLYNRILKIRPIIAGRKKFVKGKIRFLYPLRQGRNLPENVQPGLKGFKVCNVQ